MERLNSATPAAVVWVRANPVRAVRNFATRVAGPPVRCPRLAHRAVARPARRRLKNRRLENRRLENRLLRVPRAHRRANLGVRLGLFVVKFFWCPGYYSVVGILGGLFERQKRKQVGQLLGG